MGGKNGVAMVKLERVVVSAVLVVLGAFALHAAGGAVAAHASHTGAAAAPEPARFATCDVYEIMQVLVESERYKPTRQAGQEKARDELKEIAEQIRVLEQQLKSMDPKDPKSLEVFREFNAKKELFAERQVELDEFLGDQFVAAYEEVLKAADAVGEREGYTHVLASRRRGEKLPNNMEQVAQQVLSRPVLRSPAADDITDRVLAELKL